MDVSSGGADVQKYLHQSSTPENCLACSIHRTLRCTVVFALFSLCKGVMIFLSVLVDLEKSSNKTIFMNRESTDIDKCISRLQIRRQEIFF